jgi:diaminopimelate decarboxylase
MASEKVAASAQPQLEPKDYKESYGEFIGVGPNGNLWVEDCDVADLAAEFGTPLFLVSENQFRYTYRRFRDAFSKYYPAESEILFANKSNNGLAYRHIMNQEGAGGDCFGVNEMYLALLAGTDPRTLVLNGSRTSRTRKSRWLSQTACASTSMRWTNSIASTRFVNARAGMPTSAYA